jgi:signal transduction histidine kinase
VEEQRVTLLARFEIALDAIGDSGGIDSTMRGQLMVDADEILVDLIKSLRAGRVQVADSYPLTSHGSGTDSGARAVRDREWVVVGGAFFELVLQELVASMDVCEEASRALTLAVVALHQSLMMRCEDGLAAYAGRLLDKIHETQVDERNRIARDIHDRAGFWLNAAYRQLELYEAAGSAGTAESEHTARVVTARRAVKETMRSLRAITSELRHEPLRSLENALSIALEALASDDVTFRVNVSGDEAWAPHSTKDEVFLIVREAVRNAIVHGRPRLVVVGVHIAPHELRVYVDDDGTGLDPARSAASDGAGLSTMRERAELMGGRLTVSTVRGRGTHVALAVPLPGHDDE